MAKNNVHRGVGSSELLGEKLNYTICLLPSALCLISMDYNFDFKLIKSAGAKAPNSVIIA
jgi:hypothetical protein